jgi:hypothetical protein
MVDTVVNAESKEAVAADDLPTELFPSDVWPHLSMEEWGLQEEADSQAESTEKVKQDAFIQRWQMQTTMFQGYVEAGGMQKKETG